MRDSEEERLAREADLRQRVLGLDGWHDKPLRHLAAAMGVSQVDVLRALSGVRRPVRRGRVKKVRVEFSPRRLTAPVARQIAAMCRRVDRRELNIEPIVIEQLQKIPLWPLKTCVNLGLELGCSPSRLSSLIRRTPFLAEMRRTRSLQVEDFAGIDGWPLLSAEKIAARLSIPTLSVVRFFKSEPQHRPENIGAVLQHEKSEIRDQQRVAEIRAMQGWQNMTLIQIAARMGMSSERLRQLIASKPRITELFQKHRMNGWGLTAERLAEIHARCSSEEEVLAEMGTTIHHYQKALTRLGLSRPRFSRRNSAERNGLRQRLESIPGWGSLSYGELGAKLNLCPTWVCQFIHRHPDLLVMRTRRIRSGQGEIAA